MSAMRRGTQIIVVAMALYSAIGIGAPASIGDGLRLPGECAGFWIGIYSAYGGPNAMRNVQYFLEIHHLSRESTRPLREQLEDGRRRFTELHGVATRNRLGNFIESCRKLFVGYGLIR